MRALQRSGVFVQRSAVCSAVTGVAGGAAAKAAARILTRIATQPMLRIMVSMLDSLSLENLSRTRKQRADQNSSPDPISRARRIVRQR
jgi:hypothetical protein